ncbi:MAG: hypothetical protein QM775_34370 [Pirellulales bacterium]
MLESAALVEMQVRLEQAGYKTQSEEGVECCYSKQTKFWVNDPDGCLWELYVLHGDADEHDDHSPSRTGGMVGNSTFRGQIGGAHSDGGSSSQGSGDGGLQVTIGPSVAPAKATRREPIVYQHIIMQPLPERINAADGTLDDVQLQGTLNRRDDPESVRAFLRDAFRA